MSREGDQVILLVEDEAVVALIESRQLQKYGYKVITVNTGEAAVQAIQNFPEIALALVDIKLGEGMDGVQAAETILQQRELPVVFLSSNTDHNVIARTEGITSYGYVVKSAGEIALITSIKMAFRLFKAQRQEKATAAALRESEARYRALVDASPDAIILGDLEGRIITCNQQAAHLHGFEDALALQQRSIYDLFPAQEHDLLKEYALQAFRHGSMRNIECTMLRKDGSSFASELSLSTVSDAGGKLQAVIGISRNITARKWVEEALQVSEERTRILLQAVPDMIFRMDREGVFLDYKADHSDLYSQTELIVGNRNRDITPPEFADLIDQQIHATLESRQMQMFEYQLPIPTRGLREYEARMVATGSDEVTAIVRDITERKQAEKALQKAVQEKQALLRELQHRAKNSFAMMTSMVNLMQHASQGEETKNALAEIGSRIRALAELYDLLYTSNAVTEVALDHYCGRVTASLPDMSHIEIQQTYEPLTAPVEIAAPLGLMLTELLTNAIKHAFPNGRSGRVKVWLGQVEGGARLQVEDDGVGISDNFDLAACESLGLTLVQVLAGQIDGSFRFERAAGTRCVVDFSYPIHINF